MNQTPEAERAAFEAWFRGYGDPNVGAVEYMTKRAAAMAAWQAARAIPQAAAEPVAYPHPKCDSGCYYNCTKGAQQAPDCAAPDRAPSTDSATESIDTPRFRELLNRVCGARSIGMPDVFEIEVAELVRYAEWRGRAIAAMKGEGQ